MRPILLATETIAQLVHNILRLGRACLHSRTTHTDVANNPLKKAEKTSLATIFLPHGNGREEPRRPHPMPLISSYEKFCSSYNVYTFLAWIVSSPYFPDRDAHVSADAVALGVSNALIAALMIV